MNLMRLLLFVVFLFCGLFTTESLSWWTNLERRLPGIWKLQIQGTSKQQQQQQQQSRTILERLVNRNDNNQFQGESKSPDKSSSTGNYVFSDQRQQQQQQQQQQETEVLIKIRDDGSFRQYNEGYQEGKWISGRWKLMYPKQNNGEASSGARLFLAIDRQYFGPPHDSLLMGILNETDTMMAHRNDHGAVKNDKRSVTGTVSIGKFLHAKTDPCFFEEPIIMSMPVKQTGTFTLTQNLEFLTMNAHLADQKTDQREQIYDNSQQEEEEEGFQ